MYKNELKFATVFFYRKEKVGCDTKMGVAGVFFFGGVSLQLLENIAFEIVSKGKHFYPEDYDYTRIEFQRQGENKK